MYDWDDDEFEMNGWGNDDFEQDVDDFDYSGFLDLAKSVQDLSDMLVGGDTKEKFDITFSSGNKKVLKDYTFLIPDNFVTESYEGKDLYAYLPGNDCESILISYVNTFGGDENNVISESIKTKRKDALITIMNNTNVMGGNLHYIETKHAVGGFCISGCHAMLHMMTESSCVVYRISFIESYDEYDQLEMIKEIAEGFIPTKPYKGSNIKKYMPEDKYFLEGKITEGLVEEWIQALHDKNDEEALVYMKKISPIQNDAKSDKLSATDFKKVGQKAVDEYAAVFEETLKNAVEFLNSARNQNCSQKIIDKICANIDAYYEACKTVRLSFDEKVIVEKNVICPSFCRTASDDALYGQKYADALELMKSAKTKKQYEEVATAFNKIKMYKDSAKLASECTKKVSELGNIKVRFDALIKQLIVLNDTSGRKGELQDDLTKTNKMLNDAIGLKQRFPELTDEIKQTNYDIAALNKKIEALNKERGQLTVFSFKKRKEIKLKDEEFALKMTELKSKLEHLEDECECYSSISELERDVSKYKKEIEYIKGKLKIFDTCNKKSIIEEIGEIGVKEELIPLYCALYDGSYSVKIGKMSQFKNEKEDIEWIVLKRQGNKMLLISKYALDASPMYNANHNKMSYTWEKCNIREYLNNSFFNSAFSDCEKELIPTVTVPTSYNPNSVSHNSSGLACKDKLFLLGVEEAKEYFGNESERKCEYTDYACRKGARMYGNTEWWLRTPNLASCVLTINSSGQINDRALRHFYRNCQDMPYDPETCSIRPAMWIDLSL